MWVRHRRILTSFVAIALVLGVLMPTAARAQDDVSPAGFDGHSFDLPRSLADGFTAFIVREPTDALEGDDPQPPRTEFRLQLYTDEIAVPPAVGWVNVYNVSDLQDYAAYAQYQRLRDLLDERPDLSAEDTLPTLYPYQRSALPPEWYQELFVNAAYLESKGYRGITFIYGRAIRVGEGRAPFMFYRVYFEGISLDDQRYLSAQVEGTAELLEPLEGITDHDEYTAQARALFHEPDDDAIAAWLNQANLLFSSFDYASGS